MRKTVLAPGHGDVDSDEIDEVPSALAVATHHADHVRLVISGTTWTSGDLEEQTRRVFELFERHLEEFDADTRSVVRLRLQIAEPHLTPENRRLVHEVRAEFFETPHYPASTLIEVADLAHEEALIEIEAGAVVPDDGWEVEVVMDE